MGIKYTMKWMVNKMWPRIDGGASYGVQKARHESDNSSRSSSSSHFGSSSILHQSDPDFFGVDASKINILNMVLRVS
ncbi:hypothetical protein COEREDRAFT_93050 [Coemansia reversa NRRL 1564]|uniref:Uncharacterized protein n=1 Tax=Coemansia reversa (strain ATCC 12441 / NRRL 1564) TaxID=763665 RepID=A0A2G5BA09_COERN|nr:hypothetical protein COEREDRAFT_93050 [Coemansia reversa NRRL 1564]|eukprot:PIA15848.1 hypothetical protein COEREDRAFT_93050 [Coemansia reversa NRRL 1564]